MHDHAPPAASAVEIQTPPVPLVLEGASVLHQMFRLRWPAWRSADESKRELLKEASTVLEDMARTPDGWTAMFTLLGHKGDLMLTHFRRSFEELHEAEWRLARLGLWDFLEPTSSYLSVVELGLYESTGKVYGSLAERGVVPFSPEWKAEIDAVTERQKEAMRPRLFPEMPQQRYICFYPMDRKRGESRNWYQESMADRARMMHDHGMIGRRYAGEVKQIISGSIGFDDWEWGVDLFAEDPLVFKKLIYEMRFDEVSAVYAAFGTFYVGLRCTPADLSTLLSA